MIQMNFKKKLPSFELEGNFTLQNRILALVGPSGAGKTTLLQCIAGLQSPSFGEINMNGEVLFSSEKRINVPTRQRKIGYVFQDYALFPHMTVEKNILYGKKKRENETERGIDLDELLESFNIKHLRNRYPSEISGGEKQRVALARALMTEPELLLLDEPLSALDQDTRGKLQQELLKVQKRWKIPFILVTHDLKEAELLGDEIIKVERGKQSVFKDISQTCAVERLSWS